MKTQTYDMIRHQAVLDCGVLTRDVLRRFRQADLHQSILALPMPTAAKWQVPPDPLVRAQLLVRTNHVFPKFVRGFAGNLSSLMQVENRGSRAFPGNSSNAWVACIRETGLDKNISNQIAELSQIIEITSRPDLDSFRQSLGVDGDAMRPLLVVTAWYLAWRDHLSRDVELTATFLALGLPLASSVRESYALYARLARTGLDWGHGTIRNYGNFVIEQPNFGS